MSDGGAEADRRLALASLSALLAITAGWWALALWPTAEDPAAWLVRARQACFNTGPEGLPDASGWLLLIGQPIGMLAVLVAISGRALRRGLALLRRTPRGMAALVGLASVTSLGLGLATARVLEATGQPTWAGPAPLPLTYPRLDRPTPEFSLVDQRGERVSLHRFRGRPTLVTFAFGHCEAVCPITVQQTLEAQRRVREVGDTAPAVLVLTLDPWRDTPARLPHLARIWDIGADAHVLSGPVAEVEQALDAWGIGRQRDERTGDIAHPPLVFVIAPDGRMAYASTGSVGALVELLGRV